MFSMLTIIISLTISSICFVYLIFKQRNEQEFSKRNVKYCPQPTVFRRLFQKVYLHLQNDQAVQKHGPIFGYYIFNQLYIMIAEPELIQQILNKEFHNFHSRKKNRRRSLALSELDNVEHWKRLRSIVAPTFATGKLRQMKPRLDDTCQSMVNNIKEEINKSCDEINIKNFAGTFTMDSIFQIGFGVKIDSMNNVENRIISMAKELFSNDTSWLQYSLQFIDWRIFDYLPRFLMNSLNQVQIFEFFYTLSKKVIDQRKEEYEKTKNFEKASTFIEFLLEANQEYELQQKKIENIKDINNNGKHSPSKYMNEVEMVSQAILLILAGYDTTATAITLACYYLALNPDKQQLAYEEICQILEQNGLDSLEQIPFETYQTKFEYMTCVINETLRLSAPGYVLERKVENDCTLQTEDGRTKIYLKRDDLIHIPIWSLHHDPKYFPEPNKFIPERFSDENKNLMPKHVYFPFGSGPRSCIAKSLAMLEAKMALVWLIKHFRVSKCENTEIPVKYYVQHILVPKDVILRIEKRN